MANQIILMDNRQLIPRWHTSRKVMSLHYPVPPNAPQDADLRDEPWLTKAIKKYDDDPNNLNALDVYVRLIQNETTNHQYFKRVQQQLVNDKSNLPEAVQDIVAPRLHQSDISEFYTTDRKQVYLIIHKLRNIVKNNPQDALTWLDLGFYYSILGEMKKAQEVMGIGNALAPKNPFVARIYSRHLIHQDDPEKAMYLLNKTGLTKKEPLIASALISIGNTFGLRTSTSISQAKKIIEDYKGNPGFLSELQASVATLEIQNGALRKGRKHLEKAMVHPTENVLAQASWLHHKHQVNLTSLTPMVTVEGDVNKAYSDQNYSLCRDKLMELFSFQPYSRASLTDAGYLSLVGLNDPEFIISHSVNRLARKQMSFGELNNLIVANLSVGNLDNVWDDLDILKAKSAENNHPDIIGTLQATLGMALIKFGSIEEGVDLYESSIQTYKKANYTKAAAVAEFFFYTQIRQHQPNRAIKLKESFIKTAKEHGMHELEAGVKKHN